MSGGLCLLLWVQSIVGELLVCVFLPLAAQEYENGGYCNSENALREWRACGKKLSYEDFAKFHEVRFCGFIIISSSTCSPFSIPWAHNHVNHSSSNDVIFIPLIATLPLLWFITCTHWHVSLDCLVVHVIRWMIFIPFVQHAIHCLSMTCIHMFLCLY